MSLSLYEAQRFLRRQSSSIHADHARTLGVLRDSVTGVVL